MNNDKNLILVVDDQPNNLKVISSTLGEDYRISLANSGARAITILENLTPDLILLDVMMPVMDGFETIKKIKEKPKWRDIPVIFLTAKTEDDSVINGFDLGAVDYITKPFNISELKVRVRNHILLRTIMLENEDNTRKLLTINNRMSKLNDELEKRNDELKEAYNALEEHAKKTKKMYEKQLELDEKIQMQNKELSRINSEKDKFFSIISHDLRSPFSGLLGLSQLMLDKRKDITEEESNELLNDFYKSLNNLYKLVSNLLEWSRVQRGTIEINPAHLDINSLINHLKDIFETASKNKEIKLINNITESLNVYADMNTINTVFRNLISNAIKFSDVGGTITISSEITDDIVKISVQDTGIGMSPDTIGTLFNIGNKSSLPGTKGEKGTGLGLILAKEFVHKNNGKIEVQSEEGKGSTFIVSLPTGKE